MKKPRASEVERIQREVVIYSAGCTWEKATTEERIRANDVARLYVLPMLAEVKREVRRARGRTRGYIYIKRSESGRGQFIVTGKLSIAKDDRENWTECRVSSVLVPKRRRR